MKRVLCILEDGFEEIEAITPTDILRRAGAEVTLAGVSGMRVRGKCGIVVTADSLLEDVREQDFDSLFLPGGPAVMALRGHPELMALIRSFRDSGKLIAAICAAPLLLKDAGVLDGVRHTAHFSCDEELMGNTRERVVSDGLFLTSRGAGTALDFGLALAAKICGQEASDEVAKAIMA